MECYKSARMTLQKCPRLRKFRTLVTKVPYRVTKVPFFRYKSALSSGSLSLPLSLSCSLALLLSCLFCTDNSLHVIAQRTEREIAQKDHNRKTTTDMSKILLVLMILYFASAVYSNPVRIHAIETFPFGLLLLLLLTSRDDPRAPGSSFESS